MRISFPVLGSAFLFPVAARAQASPQWHDDFLDPLAGSWRVEGALVGHHAHHTVRAEWVLDHQFLRIEEKTSANAPKAESLYDPVFDSWATMTPASATFSTRWTDPAGDFRRRWVTELSREIRFPSSSSISTGRSMPRSAGMRKKVRGNDRWSNRTRTGNGCRSRI